MTRFELLIPAKCGVGTGLKGLEDLRRMSAHQKMKQAREISGG